MESNGNARPMRVDFSIRVVMDAHSYTQVGNAMDAIDQKLRSIFTSEDHAAFDFVNFNTHPCKATQMEAMVAYHNEQFVGPGMIAEDVPGPDSF